MITDINIKVRADLQEEAFGTMEKAQEYVDTEPGKYFHVIITAKFPQDFEGKLRLEISHKRSGFILWSPSCVIVKTFSEIFLSIISQIIIFEKIALPRIKLVFR